MCAFQVSYVTQIMCFEDTVFMLPLILYFVTLFIENGKYKLMCIAFLYQFLNIFYLAYIVGIFAFLYFLLYMILIKKYNVKKIIGKTLHFGILVIVTAGVAAVVLYPLAYYVITKYAVNNLLMGSMPKISLTYIYDQFFIGQNAGTYSAAPYIYCGLPAFFLSEFYIINKKTDLKEKILFSLLFVILILSCIVKPFYLFWHGFDYPDGFLYRFSFIISFLICVMACRQAEYLFNIKGFDFFLCSVINIAFYSIMIVVQGNSSTELSDMPVNNFKYLVINIIFIATYGIIFACYKCFYTKKNIKKAIIIGALFFICIEAVVNAYSSYYKSEVLWPEINRKTYELWDVYTGEAVKNIKEDEKSFFRISCLQDYATYGAMYYDYNGIAGFSSYENNNLSDFLRRVGIYTSPRIILCNGLTDFSKMLLSVKYELKTVDIGLRREYQDDYVTEPLLLKNEHSLSIGFLADSKIKEFNFNGNNAFENTNDLANALSDKDYKLYELINGGLGYEEFGINFVYNENEEYRLIYDDTDNNGYGLIFFRIPYDDRKAYVQFDYGISANDRHSPYLTDVTSGKINDKERLSASFIYQMEKKDDSYAVGICMNESTYKDIFVPGMYYAYYNENEFLRLYNDLGEGQLQVEDYHNDYIHGSIDVREDDKVLFTSIPYDEGWEILVDNEKASPIKLLDGAFIGVELSKGKHNIIFKYHVPGLKTGSIITIISLCIMILLFCFKTEISVDIKTKGNDDEGKID